jgi:hypothetical protein
VIDQAWPGAIDSDGLSVSASEPFCRMLADVRAAIRVLSAVLDRSPLSVERFDASALRPEYNVV